LQPCSQGARSIWVLRGQCPVFDGLQIRRAYRTLLTKSHPDKGGNAEQFRLIQQAYEVLSDGNKVKEAHTVFASVGHRADGLCQSVRPNPIECRGPSMTPLGRSSRRWKMTLWMALLEVSEVHPQVQVGTPRPAPRSDSTHLTQAGRMQAISGTQSMKPLLSTSTSQSRLP
jgi:hypothetical protein